MFWKYRQNSRLNQAMMSKSLLLLLFFLNQLFFVSCGSVQSVRPLEKNQQALDFSLGGALFSNLGFPLPVPESTLGYRYGLGSERDLGLQVGLSSTLFGGVPLKIQIYQHFDLHPQWSLMFSAGLGTYVSLRPVNSRANGSLLQIFPKFDIFIVYHTLENNWTSYAGLENWFQLNRASESEFLFPLIMPQLVLGQKLPLGLERWSLQFEALWSGFYRSWADSTLEYTPTLGLGVLGLRIGVQKAWD